MIAGLLILAVCVGALAAVLYRQRQRIAKLRAEVDQVNARVGQVAVLFRRVIGGEGK